MMMCVICLVSSFSITVNLHHNSLFHLQDTIIIFKLPVYTDHLLKPVIKLYKYTNFFVIKSSSFCQQTFVCLQVINNDYLLLQNKNSCVESLPRRCVIREANVLCIYVVINNISFIFKTQDFHYSTCILNI